MPLHRPTRADLGALKKGFAMKKYLVRIKEFHGTDAVYTYTFDNLTDALARVSRFLTPGNLFEERIEVDPTGFKEVIRIETIQVWLGEANEDGTEITKELGYWKFKSKLGD